MSVATNMRSPDKTLTWSIKYPSISTMYGRFCGQWNNEILLHFLPIKKIPILGFFKLWLCLEYISYFSCKSIFLLVKTRKILTFAYTVCYAISFVFFHICTCVASWRLLSQKALHHKVFYWPWAKSNGITQKVMASRIKRPKQSLSHFRFRGGNKVHEITSKTCNNIFNECTCTSESKKN